jgi:hypothetical protein
MAAAIQDGEDLPRAHERTQPLWQRMILLSVLAYEGAGSLLGGGLLIAAPDGSLMDMPVSIMHGSFRDFLIPGIILSGLGLLNAAAFIAALRKSSAGWIMAGLALGGMAVWFWVEIAVLLELHWLHAMWGLPVITGGLTTLSLIPRDTMRKALLVCGISSSLLYAAINIIVPMQWPAYSSVSQTVSELSATGALTRRLWIVLSAPYTLLFIAFALGIRSSAGQNRPLRIASRLLLVYGALGILWPFAPMHLRETLAAGGHTFSDSMHIALGAVTEILYLIALAVAAAAFGKPFRVYSIITLVLLLVFGGLSFIEAPKVAANGPTPLMGVWERINIGLFLLWVIVLALLLLKRGPAAGSHAGWHGSGPLNPDLSERLVTGA